MTQYSELTACNSPLVVRRLKKILHITCLIGSRNVNEIPEDSLRASFEAESARNDAG